MDLSAPRKPSWTDAAAAVVAALVWAAAAQGATPPGDFPRGGSDFTVLAAGFEWHCTVHVPTNYDGKKPTPLVLVLHGAGGRGEVYLDKAGWAKKSDEAGFIVVAPDGLPARPALRASFLDNPRLWNSGQLRPRSPRAGIDDLAFFRALLDEVGRRANVDQNRVYLTGHSNGAGMTFRLGAEMADRFAAIAPVASHCWMDRPRPSRALPTLYIIGTADPLVPFQGGDSVLPWGGRRYTPPVADTLRAWALANGCPTEPATVAATNGVKVVEYGPATKGVVVRGCFVEGQGHNWPGGRSVLPERMMGPNVSVFNATDVIWEFFSQRSR